MRWKERPGATLPLEVVNCAHEEKEVRKKESCKKEIRKKEIFWSNFWRKGERSEYHSQKEFQPQNDREEADETKTTPYKNPVNSTAEAGQ